MNNKITYNQLSFITVAIFTLVLCIYASGLGISYDEAKLFYNEHGLAHYLSVGSVELLGQNDLAIRFPFIIIHSLSAYVFWRISKLVCKKESDAYIALLIFIFMPGLNMTALLANKSGLLLFSSLLSAYFLLREKYVVAFMLLTIGALSDNGYAVFLLGITAWAFSDRKYKFGAAVGILFLICMVRFGFADGGSPKGWFLETIGAYFALFSPLVFAFYLYALFKLRRTPSLLWQITFWSIALSLVLSLRQRIPLIDYAPYSIFAIPLAVNFFAKEWRTRLPELRIKYKIFGIITFATLVLWGVLAFFMSISLLVVTKPELCPLWPHMVAKELAIKLLDKNITSIDANSSELQTRLKWYGIEFGSELVLSTQNGDAQLAVSQNDRLLKTFYIQKSNK